MKTKKILSMLLALCLLLALLPAAAFATGTKKAIQLVDKSGATPSAVNIEGAQAGNVYFGTYPYTRADGQGRHNDAPIKWRVLQNADGRLFLLADQNLDAFKYNESYTSVTWETSTLRARLNGTGDYTDDSFKDEAFTGAEFAAVALTEVVNADNPVYDTQGGNDTTDKVFLLSIAEAKETAYGFSNSSTPTDTRVSRNTFYATERGVYNYSNRAGYWWLRSPGSYDDSAALVSHDGSVGSEDHVDLDSVGVRPALNIDLNTVLFTSAAGGGKSSGAVGQSALTAVSTTDAADWKLTLLDDGSANAAGDGHEGFTASYGSASGDVWTINYSGAKPGADEYISAMVVNTAGAVTYYGRLAAAAADPATGTNTVTVDLEGKYNDGDTLYVFNEQYNGDYMTDYASALVEIAKPVTLTGSGTESDPYQIDTAAQLKEFRDIVNGANGLSRVSSACAILAADIALENDPWTPIGCDSLTAYSGIFDGAGHSVTGLNVSTDACFYTGLFGFIDKGTVKDICVSGSVICTNNNGIRAGGLAGKISDGYLEGCTFSGTVSGSAIGGKAAVGGIAGEICDSEVKGCGSSGEVDAVTTGSQAVAGGLAGEINNSSGQNVESCRSTSYVFARGSEADTGGFAGILTVSGNSTVHDCYAAGDAYSRASESRLTYAGGFAGIIANTDGTIRKCWSSGMPGSYLGGHVLAFEGTCADNDNIIDCFWMNGYHGGCGIHVTENQAKQISTFSFLLDFNLDTVWHFTGTGVELWAFIPHHAVRLTPGEHMTRDPYGGHEAQAVAVYNSMNGVYYTADDGYYFPVDYAVAEVNGVSVTRDSYTKITVSGTPTADAAITLTAPTAKTKEPTPAATFTATGPDTGTLTGVAPGMIYAIDGGAATAITGTSVDLTGLAACTITVIQPGNGTTTIDSDTQTITVTKAAAPDTVTAEGCTTYLNNNGKLIGVTAAMEYKASDAASWAPGTGGDVTGLASGTCLVRMAAAGTALASDAQEITVAAYVAPPSDDDWTPVPVTEINSGESISSAELDRLIREGKTLTVEAEDGSKVEISSDALKDLAKNSTGTIKIEFSKVVPSQADGTAEDDTKVAYDLTVSAGGKPVDFSGKVTVKPTDADEKPLRTASVKSSDGRRHFVVSSKPFPYTDVPAGSYYYDAVNWADLMGITEGTGPKTFGPLESCTRAQMLTFLWRAAGCPEPTAKSSPFGDVDPEAYYYNAVLWAWEQGITLGTGDGTFGPDLVIDRGQSVTFLYRAMGGTKAGGNGFDDVDPDSYCYEAVLWAAEQGITLGTGDGNFSPDEDCLRAQIMTFLYRAYNGDK